MGWKNLITDYITRKMTAFAEARSDADKLNALYDLAAHSRILPRERLLEVSERYTFSAEEQERIVDWAIAQLELAQ
jgi:hypothetical protein